MRTIVELSEDDAILFRAFRKHQDNFSILYASGVFEIVNGSAQVHFDKDKKVSLIDVHTYHRYGEKVRGVV